VGVTEEVARRRLSASFEGGPASAT
jgi:hypothetical protein